MRTYEQQIQEFADLVYQADAILVGAAAGMSAASGHDFYYRNDRDFQNYFGDFYRRYGFIGAFSGFYYPYPTSEARWAFLGRLGSVVDRLEAGKPYDDLMKLLNGKNYHILTTNEDCLFNRFVSDDKLSAIQGEIRFFQCSRCCHDQLYDSIETLHKLNDVIDTNLEIPTSSIPRCPQCGAEMAPWIRGDLSFLDGARYHEEYRKVQDFLSSNKDGRILFLELGVGMMTPTLIKEPFWNLTSQLPEARYVTVNPNDALVPRQIRPKSLAIQDDIAHVLSDAVQIA